MASVLGCGTLVRSLVRLFYKSQGRAAAVIFLWSFPFFCAAEKPEKSGICCKNCSAARAGHLVKATQVASTYRRPIRV